MKSITILYTVCLIYSFLSNFSRIISETNFAKEVCDAHKYTYKDKRGKINENTNNNSSCKSKR